MYLLYLLHLLCLLQHLDLCHDPSNCLLCTGLLFFPFFLPFFMVHLIATSVLCLVLSGCSLETCPEHNLLVLVAATTLVNLLYYGFTKRKSFNWLVLAPLHCRLDTHSDWTHSPLHCPPIVEYGWTCGCGIDCWHGLLSLLGSHLWGSFLRVRIPFSSLPLSLWLPLWFSSAPTLLP